VSRPSFDDCRGRLDRASSQIDDADKAIGRFLGDWPKPYAIRSEIDPQTGDHIWYAEVHAEPPLPLRLLIGECVHNIRASLDNAMWELGLAYRGPPPDKLDFPVCFKPKGWKQSGWKVEAVPEAARSIIEDAQPYKRPEAERASWPLYMLDRLWNDDKHRAPSIVGAVATGSRLRIIKSGHGLGITPDSIKYGPFRHEREIARFVMVHSPDPETEIEGEFTLGIAFDEEGAAKGGLVVPTLRKLHEFVRDDVLAKLDAAC
jgi:hypothetical protein